MIRYLAGRLAQSCVVLVGVSLLTFILLYVLPADPARMVAGRSANPDVVAAIRRELGLDRPLPERYAHYVSRLLRGDLGRSYVQKVDVADLVGSRLGATAQLMAAGILFELLLGLPAGIAAAVRRGSAVDRLVMVAAFAGASAPQFAVGLLLLYVLSFRFGWFPLGGYGTWQHVVLPAVTLGLAGGGWYARVMRSALVEVLDQDYVRTGRAKGLTPRRVLFRHALQNALIPVVSMVGLDVGTFMGGVVVVESVFGWPGIGQLAWQAIQMVDVPVILGVVLTSALAILAGNLLADLCYPFLDPRVRYG